jgi:hypothetical protein
MKFLITFLLLTSAAFAGTNDDLACKAEFKKGQVVLKNLNFMTHGNVYYAYSTGRIICPALTGHRMKNKENFRCQGIWDFNHSNDEHNESLVVDFKHNGDHYVAEFQTDVTFNHSDVALNCQF